MDLTQRRKGRRDAQRKSNENDEFVVVHKNQFNISFLSFAIPSRSLRLCVKKGNVEWLPYAPSTFVTNTVSTADTPP